MPTPSPQEERFRILEALGLLDATPDPSMDRFVRIAARAARAPIALVTFLAPDRQVNKARLGYREPYVPLSDAFCLHALDRREPLEVPDALQDPRVAASQLVAGPPAVRAYAGHPILFKGIVLGTVCVLDTVARRFSALDREVLADLSGVVSDLLALRHEHQLRRLQEQRATDCAAAAGEWLWETDAQHRISWLAGRLDDEVGRLAGDRVGEPLADREVLSGLGRPAVPPCTLRELLDRHVPVVGAVAHLGEPAAARFVERNASPWFGPDGAFRGFRGSCREVTDRVRAEVLALDTDAARRASRSKSEFLSRMSHELRTPLNAILGFAQLMLMDDSDAGRPTPVQRQRLDAMLQGGQRLLSLINDMLDLARIEQGRLDMTLEALDVHAVVQACELLLRPLCAEKQVTVRQDVAPGECAVWADRRALGQVLLNLLANAVKYQRAGGHVTVRAEPDSHATLVVEDDGPGMTPAQLASLYQPFNRLGAEGGPVGGSGLGLVICKTLVERMHGEIAVDSRPGVGTTVRVTLPVPPGDGGASSAPEADRRAPVAPAPAAAQRTVLYIEDNAINAMMMEELFAGEPPWQLAVVASGRAGIERAASAAYDLVLIDMHLDDMTGLDVLRALQAAGARPARGFVAVSADAFPEQVQAALDAGFVEYWTKPLDLRQTQQRLRELLA
ncbi:MAG TPA: ATP-binding protein [Albitalea sp.]